MPITPRIPSSSAVVGQKRNSSNALLTPTKDRTIQNLVNVRERITTNRHLITSDPAERDSLEKDELKVLSAMLTLYDSETDSRAEVFRKAFDYIDDNVTFTDPINTVRGKKAYIKQFAFLHRKVKRFELEPYQVSFLHSPESLTKDKVESRMIIDCTTSWSFFFTTLRVRQELICHYHAFPGLDRNPLITSHEDIFSFAHTLLGIPILGWIYYYWRVILGRIVTSTTSSKFPRDQPTNPALVEHEKQSQ